MAITYHINITEVDAEFPTLVFDSQVELSPKELQELLRCINAAIRSANNED